MVIFAGIAGGISILVGWLVTLRLFALARRTRGIPERLLAIGFGGLFCVGYPLAGASRAPGLNTTHEGALLFAIGTIGMAIGIAALGRFPLVVFRPEVRWAKLLSAVITVAGTIACAGCAISVARATTASEMISQIQPWAILLMTSVAFFSAWNGAESTRYYLNMKRRLALGLAQPETTHRFLLWAIASWGTVGPVVLIATMRASGTPIVSTLPMMIIAGSTLITSACWWLAFFMPEAYRTRVLGPRDEAQSQTG